MFFFYCLQQFKIHLLLPQLHNIRFQTALASPFLNGNRNHVHFLLLHRWRLSVRKWEAGAKINGKQTTRRKCKHLFKMANIFLFLIFYFEKKGGRSGEREREKRVEWSEAHLLMNNSALTMTPERATVYGFPLNWQWQGEEAEEEVVVSRQTKILPCYFHTHNHQYTFHHALVCMYTHKYRSGDTEGKGKRRRRRHHPNPSQRFAYW